MWHELSDMFKLQQRFLGPPGTTWMSALVYMLVNGGNPKSLLSGPPLKFKMPYLEMTVPCGEKLEKEIRALDYLKANEGERTYLTHLNSTAIPQDILKTAKVSIDRRCEFNNDHA